VVEESKNSKWYHKLTGEGCGVEKNVALFGLQEMLQFRGKKGLYVN